MSLVVVDFANIRESQITAGNGGASGSVSVALLLDDTELDITP